MHEHAETSVVPGTGWLQCPTRGLTDKNSRILECMLGSLILGIKLIAFVDLVLLFGTLGARAAPSVLHSGEIHFSSMM